MKGWWQELIVDNPMQVDMRRFARKFFTFQRINVANATVLVLAALSYVMLILVALSFSSGLDATVFLLIQTFLYCLIIPSALHGAIAGEREKRTWDLLLAAPISKPQIVVGKFLTGVAVTLVIAALMLVPAIITIPKDSTFSLGTFFHCEVISISFGICVSALSLFFSARAKRAFAAQGTIFGILVLGLILWPVFVFIIAGSSSFDRITQDVLLGGHPFYAMGRVIENARQVDYFDTGDRFSMLYLGWFHVTFYAFFTGFFLVYAVKTIHFAENTVTFIGNKKRRSDA